jgi:hypothetical protein
MGLYQCMYIFGSNPAQSATEVVADESGHSGATDYAYRRLTEGKALSRHPLIAGKDLEMYSVSTLCAFRAGLH